MPTQTQVIRFNFSVKWTLIGLLSYIALTVIGSFFISNNWMTLHDINGLSPQEIGILMGQDTKLAIYTSTLGGFSAIFCGWLVTQKTQCRSYMTALIIAACLAIGGIISIIIHPDHVVLHQIGKIVGPFFACSIGAWIAIIFQRRSNIS